MAALGKAVEMKALGNPQKCALRMGAAVTVYGGGLLFGLIGVGGATNAPAGAPAAPGPYVQPTPFLGIAVRNYGLCADGDLVEAWVGGIFQFPVITGITSADEGDALVLDQSASQTDNPADLVSAVDATMAVCDLLIGQILYVPTGEGPFVQLKKGTGIYNANGWGG